MTGPDGLPSSVTTQQTIVLRAAKGSEPWVGRLSHEPASEASSLSLYTWLRFQQHSVCCPEWTAGQLYWSCCCLCRCCCCHYSIRLIGAGIILPNCQVVKIKSYLRRLALGWKWAPQTSPPVCTHCISEVQNLRELKRKGLHNTPNNYALQNVIIAVCVCVCVCSNFFLY